MPRVGIELTIPMFERAMLVHALGRAPTVIGHMRIYTFGWEEDSFSHFWQ
jgi:hypothetical protein